MGRALRLTKRIALGVLALIVVAVLVGAGWERAMRSRAAEQYPPPGKLVDVGGGRRLHVDCRGAGSPTVVLESGLDDLGALAWSAVHDSIAATTRTCAYSRPGIMWSDPRPQFDPDGYEEDLHTALAAAGEHAPYVLVGHSLGGPYIMIYTRHYPADVAGLVFVDASHPDQVERLRKATGAPMNADPGFLARTVVGLAWTGVVRAVVPSGIPPTAPRWIEPVSHSYFPTSIGNALDEAAGLPATLRSAGQLRTLGDRPVVVLTAMAPMPAAVLQGAHMTEDQGKRMQAEWKALQDEEASWSTQSRHEIVTDATHYIQFDRPPIVIAAVREVVARVRANPTPATAK